MAKVKVPRKSTAIDMTAMCDVAFLLLTFFILTAKPRTEDPVPIDTPRSSIEQPLPEENVATLTVGKGKVFYSIAGTDVRKQTLQQMGEKYKVQFTPQEQQTFSVLPVFGVPIAQLKQYLNLDVDKRKAFPQSGIPTDSVSMELFNWIRESRIADKALHGKELRLSIKGDSQEEYPTIKKIIDILQKQKVNKFSLITSLRGVSK